MLTPDEKLKVRTENPIDHLGDLPANSRKIAPAHVRAAEWRLLDAIAAGVMGIIAGELERSPQDMFDLGMVIADLLAELRFTIKHGKANAAAEASRLKPSEGFCRGESSRLNRHAG